MKPEPRNPDLAAIARDMRRAMQTATAILDRLDRALASIPPGASKPLQSPAKRAFKARLKGKALDAWRAARRPSYPSLIDCDDELRAFILANLPGSTYAATVDAIAATFPPERRVKKSALQAWWKRHLAAQPASD